MASPATVKVKHSHRIDMSLIEEGVGKILEGMHIDATDPNFIDTPERYARFIVEMFGHKEVEYATFPEDFTDFILVRNHTIWSLCPHHLLPVEFRVAMAYIPNREVLGLSKLIRVLDECNTGPLLQERFTNDVLNKLYENVPTIQGAACFIDGQHGCTHVRGVRSEARFSTYKLRGLFLKDKNLEDRFFRLALR